MTNLSNFHLTFDDEFNSFSGWDTTIFGSRTLSRNSGQEYYSDSSVGINPFALHSGELTITAAPGSNPVGLAYDSGIITTFGHFSQEYGYFEMRAELPQGAGMWPGFWLLPTSQAWPPEIDILEAFGANAADGQGGSNMVHVNAISTIAGESTRRGLRSPAASTLPIIPTASTGKPAPPSSTSTAKRSVKSRPLTTCIKRCSCSPILPAAVHGPVPPPAKPAR